VRYTLKREYPEAPLPAVSGVVFDADRRVLLIQRASQPARGKWSLPGGVVQLGEELEKALEREVWEECGLKVETKSLLTVSSRIVMDASGKILYHFVLLDYLCNYVGGILKAGSDASEAKWVNFKEIIGLDLTKGVLEVIQKGFDTHHKVIE
jgi:8-oxo-dGTP diphosphatase